MNSFNLTLSGKHFICPSILNDSFAGQTNPGCRFLPFMTWNTSFQPHLACKVSFEKSADSLRGTPLQVTDSFSLAAFKILSFSLILGNLVMMHLVCSSSGPIYLGLWVFWSSQKSISFTSFPLLLVQINFQYLALPLLLMALLLFRLWKT